MPADPEHSELIPGEDLGRVCASQGLAHLAGRYPGPGVLMSPQDNLDHACCVLGPGGQGHPGVVVGSHSHVKTAKAPWSLHVLELVFVGCGDVDSLWMGGRKGTSWGHLENQDHNRPVSLWLDQQLLEPWLLA